MTVITIAVFYTKTQNSLNEIKTSIQRLENNE